MKTTCVVRAQEVVGKLVGLWWPRGCSRPGLSRWVVHTPPPESRPSPGVVRVRPWLPGCPRPCPRPSVWFRAPRACACLVTAPSRAGQRRAGCSRPAGVQFEVKRVELRGPAPLFCCWLVKDLLHGHQASATWTHLLLASPPSAMHSVCEHPGPSLGEVGVCGHPHPQHSLAPSPLGLTEVCLRLLNCPPMSCVLIHVRDFKSVSARVQGGGSTLSRVCQSGCQAGSLWAQGCCPRGLRGPRGRRACLLPPPLPRVPLRPAIARTGAQEPAVV